MCCLILVQKGQSVIEMKRIVSYENRLVTIEAHRVQLLLHADFSHSFQVAKYR